jgi:hypothetical protein
MGREKRLFALTAGHRFLDNGAATGAQQFKAGFAAVGQFFRIRRRRPAAGHPKLRRGGIVHQQEAALRVLNRHAAGERSENIPQNAELGIHGESATGFRRGGLRVVFGAALHDREVCQALL